jgi:ANTAR domain-containing protein/GAF domain-containing protein
MQQSIEVVGEQVHSESGIQVAIAQLIHNVRNAVDVDQSSIWALATAAALKLSAVDYASITRVGQRDVVRTLATTDGHPRILNKLQQRYREGPSLDAACENRARRVDNLTHETRWPTFSREAAATTPIRSMLCVPLFARHNGKAALNMYANQPYAFGTESELTGVAFANDVAAILEVGRREKLYRRTVNNRDMIGQAKGILMQRFAVDPVAAFSLLAQLSRHRQQAVSVFASGLVGDGPQLPSEEMSCRPLPLAQDDGELSAPSGRIRSSASAIGSKRY